MSESHNGSASLDELRTLIEQLTKLACKPADPREKITVCEVIVAYLDDAKEEVCKANYEEKKRILGWFTDDYGARLVATCNPLELQTWIKQHPGWVSKWTKQRVNRTVQRAMNWACHLRMIRENPFKGACTGGRAAERQSMTDEEFRALLRSSEPIFRRFITFLKFTGCRPGEASALRWSHIDWERCIAVIPEHKTVKKSGKPRILVLVPTIMKMLAYIRRHPHIKGKWSREAADVLYGILLNGPLSFEQVAERMDRFHLHSIRRARVLIGATCRRVGFGSEGYHVWELGKDSPNPNSRESVFLNSWGRPFKTSGISQYMKQLRERSGVSKKVVLHLLRHRFISNAIKAGVNLKVVAELAGHARVATTETYTHISDDVGLLQQAAQKVNGHCRPEGGKP